MLPRQHVIVVEWLVNTAVHAIFIYLPEITWISSVYDYKECTAWVEHAQAVQAQVRTAVVMISV